MIDQAQRLREIQSRAGQKVETNSNIISITSGKGGTGKSFVSFYLAQSLALKGYKTLLIEFDHNMAALAFHLNIEPENTLLNFFYGSVFFEDLPVKVQENLHVVFGESGKLQYPQNKISYIQNFMNTLRKKSSEYDFIIVDNGAGINAEVFETIRASDLNIIVTLPDPVAVMDAYVLVKLMVKNSLHTARGILINKCSDTSEGETTFNNLNKASLNFFNESLDLMGIIGEFKSLQALKLIGEEDRENQSYSQILHQFDEVIKSMVKFRHLANNHQRNSFKDSK